VLDVAIFGIYIKTLVNSALYRDAG